MTLCEATLQFCTLCVPSICSVRVNDDDDDNDDDDNNNNNNKLSIRNLVANADCQRDRQCRIISTSDNSCFRTTVIYCTMTGP